MAKSSAPLGITSLVFAGLSLLLFALHYLNVFPTLNTVITPMFSLFGTLLGMLGFFERDKKRSPALVGLLFNAALLIFWIVLLVLALTALPS